MKKYNTLLVVIFTFLFVALLTWILPITYLNGEFVSAERAQMGINELFSYPIYTFYNFIYVLAYLLIIGGFYGILNKTSAYRLILERIVKFVKGRELLFFIPTVLILATIVSFTGFTFEALIFLPFIAAIVLLLGYDKITAALTTIGTVSVGIIGTTFSSLVAGTFNDILSTTYIDLWIVKVVLLVLGVVILLVNIILHNRKIERTENVEENMFIPEKVKDKNVKVWPLITILVAFVLILVTSSIAFEDAFGVTFFTTSLQSLSSYRVLDRFVVLGISLVVVLENLIRYGVRRAKVIEANKHSLLGRLRSIFRRNKDKNNGTSFIKLMGKVRLIVTIVFAVIFLVVLSKVLLEDVFKVTNIFTKALTTIKLDGVINGFTFGTLIGGIRPLGTWTYNEYIVLTVVVMTIIKLVYSVKINDAIEACGTGMKKVFYAAMVCLLAYTVLIALSNHPVMLTVLKPLLTLTDGLNNLTLALSTFVSALFNTDFTYYQYGILNLSYVTSYITDTSVYPLCGVITQSMYGLAMLVAPTSVVMLFSLSTLKISYLEWLKHVWKLFVELLVVLLITFMVVLMLI